MDTRQKQSLLFILVALSVIAAPAIVVIGVNLLRDGQIPQPLGVTKESLARAEGLPGEEGQPVIAVKVLWGGDWSGELTQQQLQNRLVATIDVRTDYYQIDFIDVPGDRVSVTISVGQNRYGPFAPNQIASGLIPAFTVQGMAQAR